MFLKDESKSKLMVLNLPESQDISKIHFSFDENIHYFIFQL